MTEMPTYPSKVMLVGEYAAIVGGGALTIPFPMFRARIRSTKDIPFGKEKEAGKSIDYLKLLHDYILGIPAGRFHAAPDLGYFKGKLHAFWLDLSIPVGFGLGSSGAVSAAVYDLFFPGSRSLSLDKQKEDLGLIESFFHGKSSGVDALTCYARSALRFRTEGVQKVPFDPEDLPGGHRFFLLNSGHRFDTAPLVNNFLESMQDPVFRGSVEEEYLPLNEKLIETLVGERREDPARLMKKLSAFQLESFREMIPENMSKWWIEGQHSDEFYLKLNGSGGGYMLGMTREACLEDLQGRWGQDMVCIGRDQGPEYPPAK